MKDLDLLKLPDEASAGIRADDPQFMARFAGRLALERRPVPPPRPRWSFGLEVASYAAAAALTLRLLMPSWAELAVDVKMQALSRIGALGLSPSQLLIGAAAVLTVAVVAPRWRDLY